MFKYILQSLAVLVLLQGLCSAKSIDSNSDVAVPAGIIDAVIAALEKLRQFVDGLVQTALQKVQELYEIVNTLAEGIIGDTLNKIADLIVGSVRAINQIKEKAIELGVNVAECIGDSEDKIKNIGITMTEDVKRAIGSAVKNSHLMVNETRAAVSSALNDIKGLEEKFKECGGITALPCYLDLMKNIGLQTAAIPLRIAGLVAKLTTNMLKTQATIAVIGAEAVTKATVQTAKIVADVTVCAGKKFDENQMLLLMLQ